MPSDAVFAALDERLDQIAAALRLMIATQHTHTEILSKLLEAAAPSEESDGLPETMRRIAEALEEQTAVLQHVEAELGGLGAEVEAGVVRGLAQALGVEETSETAEGMAGRGEEGSAPALDCAGAPEPAAGC